MYRYFFKRLIDFFAAFIGFVTLSPIFLLITICLLIANQGRPFFFQSRPGKNARAFRIIKFKTMNDKKDNKEKLLPDEKRLTSVGRFIRRTSLDEIPQLLNVMKGDMSLIGPRPLLVRYLPYFTDEERIRFSVRPGITGWAQVNGRNRASWDERLAADIFYVKNLSFKLDMKILLKTIKNVILSKDIAVNSAIMPDFDEERKNNLKHADRTS